MKYTKMRYFIILACTIFAMPIAVYAGNEIPIYEDFENGILYELDGWSTGDKKMASIDDYVCVTDGKLVLSTGEGGEEREARFELSKPVYSGTVVLEYTFKTQATGGRLASYWGLGTIYENSKSAISDCAVRGLVLSNTDTLGGISVLIDREKENHVKTVINIDEGYYMEYLNGDLVSDESGKSRFEFNGESVGYFRWNLAKTTAGAKKIYIDDVKVYSLRDRVIYISPDGDDLWDGTFDKPVKSFTRASELFDSKKTKDYTPRVVLMSGTYTLPNGFKLGEIGIEKATTGMVIYPRKGADISITNADNVIDETKLSSLKQEYRDSITEKINGKYVDYVDNTPVKLTDYSWERTGNQVSYTLNITNDNIDSKQVMLIFVLFEDGVMQNVSCEKLDIDGGNSIISGAKELKYDGKAEYKMFVIENLNNIIPIDKFYFSGKVKNDAKIVNYSEDLIEINQTQTYKGERRVKIFAKAAENIRISAKMYDENNNLIYLGQFDKAAREFIIECKTSAAVEENTLYIKGVTADE